MSSAQLSFSPEEIKNAGAGVLIDNKIIIFDSIDFTNTHAFSLDLSKDWTTTTPEFTIYNLVSAPTFITTAFSAQIKGDHAVIYAFGGNIPKNGNFSDLIYTNDFYKIDVNTSPFSFLRVDSGDIAPKARASSVIDEKGKLYIWGGITALDEYTTVDKYMYIFDTFDSTWRKILPSYVPAQRSQYTSTLKDGKIYYIGGFYSDHIDYAKADIRQILIYDTLNDTSPWSLKTATNKTNISDRFGHSAVLAPDNRSIIIFGGLKVFSDTRTGSPDEDIKDYLITLDLETFELSELKTQNKLNIDDIPGGHTGVIYNNFLIVTFGAYPTKSVTRKNQQTAIHNNRLQTQPNTVLSHNIPTIVIQHATTQIPFDPNTTLAFKS
ncbi:13315_t:CDS:2 [Ambispora gerdemannii]|uniref:13315_t:CDS:1 n=1 Tax=Ambispora gerdemannii TaxID=144530 RepID=A0A9N9BAY3_9GLOM|nr:13315_t:CDS:2 [Ambispora gerdemannii]